MWCKTGINFSDQVLGVKRALAGASSALAASRVAATLVKGASMLASPEIAIGTAVAQIVYHRQSSPLATKYNIEVGRKIFGSNYVEG